MTTRPRVRAVTPLFVVSDLPRSVDFYCQQLGFGKPSVYGDPPCFAMLYRDGFELMLRRAEDPGYVKPHGSHGVWDLYISVADVAAERAALAAAGVKIDKGPTDTFYSMREIEVLDPDGHRICFAQDITGELQGVTETWEGTLDLGEKQLRLVLKLAPSQGGLAGRLDSLDQGAMNLPIDLVKRDGSALRFEMSALDASFEGTIDGANRLLTGQWSQRGRKWPLVLRRT